MKGPFWKNKTRTYTEVITEFICEQHWTNLPKNKWQASIAPKRIRGLIGTGTNLLITFSSRTGSNTGQTGLKTDDRPDRPKRRNKVQFNDKLALALNYS